MENLTTEEQVYLVLWAVFFTVLPLTGGIMMIRDYRRRRDDE